MIPVHALWLMSALDLVAETASFESTTWLGYSEVLPCGLFGEKMGLTPRMLNAFSNAVQLAFITEKTIEHSE